MQMDSKFSVLPTIRDHYRTLVDQNDDEWYWPDYAVLLGVPAAGGVAVGYFYQLRDMAAYIGGVAVFTALLFAMVVYVFQLRMQLLSNPFVPRDGALARFVDQLFANVSYAVVVGIATTVVSMAAAVTAPDSGHVNHVWSGVVVGFGVHLMLVVFMCLKRIRAAYREIKSLPRSTHVSS
jgi:membrane associated rhomboid family serine protease